MSAIDDCEERIYNRGREDVLSHIRYWLDYDEFRNARLLFSEEDTKMLRKKIDELMHE